MEVEDFIDCTGFNDFTDFIDVNDFNFSCNKYFNSALCFLCFISLYVPSSFAFRFLRVSDSSFISLS